MPPKQQKEIVTAIATPEQFLELIAPENKKLIGTSFNFNNNFSNRRPSDMVRAMRCYDLELQINLVQL